MTRASIVVCLTWSAIAAAEAQAPQRRNDPPPRVQVAAPVIAPGLYQSAGFVTRFDPKGNWTTTNEGTRSTGRYTIEGNTITFRTTPPMCPEERVTYRVVADGEGFRLDFVSDTCQRAGTSFRFTPVRATVAK